MTYALLHRRSEWVLLVAGVLLVGVAGLSSLRYHLFQSSSSGYDGAATQGSIAAGLPAEWRDRFLAAPSVRTLGRIEIPRLRLSVLVVDGDEEQGLGVAAVHLAGTAALGGSGNAVIAGHRDTAFWPLRNIKIGDLIRIRERRERSEYRVDTIRVVAPDDLSVLKSSPEAALTLVTCYPFRYVGSAPQRFVVRAHLRRQ